MQRIQVIAEAFGRRSQTVKKLADDMGIPYKRKGRGYMVSNADSKKLNEKLIERKGFRFLRHHPGSNGNGKHKPHFPKRNLMDIGANPFLKSANEAGPEPSNAEKVLLMVKEILFLGPGSGIVAIHINIDRGTAAITREQIELVDITKPERVGKLYPETTGDES